MNSGWGVATPPQERLNRQVDQSAALMPVVQKILAGEKVEGITPKLAQQLMGVFKPDDLINLQDRGWNVNPNWYQNYFQPGTVNPETYNAIMGYSGQFWGRDDLPEPWLGAESVPWQPWTEQAQHNLGMSGQPTYRQQLMQNAYDRARMSMQGQVLDPVAGEWRYDPNIAMAMFKDTVGELGIGQSVEDNEEVKSLLQRIADWMGLGSEKAPPGTTAKMMIDNTDTTMPIVAQPEVNAIRTALGVEPLYPQGGLALSPNQAEAGGSRERLIARSMGLTPEMYTSLAQTLTKEITDRQSFELEVGKLAQVGITKEILDRLSPSWWVELKARVGVQ